MTLATKIWFLAIACTMINAWIAFGPKLGGVASAAPVNEVEKPYHFSIQCICQDPAMHIGVYKKPVPVVSVMKKDEKKDAWEKPIMARD